MEIPMGISIPRQTWPVTRDGSPPLQLPVPSFPRAPCYNFTQFPVVGNAAAPVRTEQFGGDLSAFDDQLLCSAIVQLHAGDENSRVTHYRTRRAVKSID